MTTLRFATLLLALATPALCAEPTSGAPAADDVFYPRSSPQAQQAEAAGGTGSTWTMLALIGALAGGGYYLVRRGNLRTTNGTQVRQRLAIEETKALGNKQYLAVAAYGERKFLIAVCPGRIDLLTRLEEPEGGAPATKPAEVALPADA